MDRSQRVFPHGNGLDVGKQDLCGCVTPAPELGEATGLSHKGRPPWCL